MFIVGCASEKGGAQGAVRTALWRSDIEKLTKGKLFDDTAWEDRRKLSETEGKDQFGNKDRRWGWES